MDVDNVQAIEKATSKGRRELFRFGWAFLFVVAVGFYTYYAHGHISLTLVFAAVIGAYMAMNIGANDVANNVGPAVGSGALTMTTAIVIAAIFEAGGAIIAGGNVVTTIKGGIIDPADIGDAQTFIWLMLAALLAAALWLNLATLLGAPVSTTHSIVGGVMGAGIAAAGSFAIANWGTVGQIVASWVVSPVLGGVIAASLLFLIKRSITYQDDRMEAARRWVPYFLALMAWAFVTFLMIKGLSQVMTVGFLLAAVVGLAGAVLTYFITLKIIARTSHKCENSKAGVNKLFTIPLIFAAALLSFAHGSNDVANAIGPLAAISDALQQADVEGTSAAIPLWVLVVGALGLAVGLALYGSKMIRTVGSEITDIDQMRAYCIAMAAALTVILASQLGLPISTTHVTVGAVFGVGFLREYIKSNYLKMEQQVQELHPDRDHNDEKVQAYLQTFRAASIKQKKEMLNELKDAHKRREQHISKRQRKGLKKIYKRELVKRSLMLKVIAAWVITVPASAILAAMIFFTIRGMMMA